MAHWIGHSKIKTLDYYEFFERKMIIDELDDSLTVTTIDATNTELLEISIETNDDEDITAGYKVGKINKDIS